jgi:hypothetical protein
MAIQLPPVVDRILKKYSLTFLLTVFVGVSGYYFGQFVVYTDSGKQYYFYALNGQGKFDSGFWCDCPRSSSKWSGAGDHGDCTNIVRDNDLGREIPGGIISLPKPPTSTQPGMIACCKDRPKVIKRKSLTNPSQPEKNILVDSPSC